MEQVEMSKEEAGLRALEYLRNKKAFKESKLEFQFSPALIMAIYIATYHWGKLNNSAFRSYFHHLKHIKDWLFETRDKNKFKEKAVRKVDEMFGKDMTHFYNKIEKYCEINRIEIDYDEICDAIGLLINNHIFSSEFVMTVEIISADIIKYIPYPTRK